MYSKQILCLSQKSREKYIPVMSDFYDILMAQPEEEAKEIALSLELFVNGSLNILIIRQMWMWITDS